LLIEKLSLLILKLSLQFLDRSLEVDDMLFFVVDFLHDILLTRNVLLHQLHLVVLMSQLPVCSQLLNLHFDLVQFIHQLLSFLFVGCDQGLLLDLGFGAEC
jgi:hypothetical protein